MTPQSVDSVDTERRLVEEFYNLPVHVNPGLILAPFLSGYLQSSSRINDYLPVLTSLESFRSTVSAIDLQIDNAGIC